MVTTSAFFWGVQVFLIGIVAKETGLPVFVSALSFLVTGVLSMSFAYGLETVTVVGIQAGWAEILYTGILSTAVAYTLQAVGQQHVPPANAAIILSAESLFAALGGALLLNERLLPIGYFGAALIFIAIVLVEAIPIWQERRAAAAG
jgi:drug/metabolite transporter (DMT)-like permease